MTYMTEPRAIIVESENFPFREDSSLIFPYDALLSLVDIVSQVEYIVDVVFAHGVSIRIEVPVRYFR
jgi:hypothetical protein